MTAPFAGRVAAALADLPFIRRIHCYDELPSTSDYARSLAAQAPADRLHGVLVIADFQTAGRGRHRRAWAAPRGRALLFSLLLDPAQTPGLTWLPMAAAVALCDAVPTVAPGVSPRIKYPNDVLVGGRKVAGILVEQAGPSQAPCAVVGVGINVNQSAEELPPGTRVPPTSLALARGAPLDRMALLAAVLGGMASHCLPGTAGLLARANALCDTVGRMVEVHTTGGIVAGTAMSVGPDGALMVRTESGIQQAVTGGDVTQLDAR